MKKRCLTVALLAFVPGVGFAQGDPSYHCTHGDLTRRVAVVSETGVTVPCEVHYYKDTEAPGEQRVLWRALHEEGYCEAKADEFVAKLTGWGWICSQTDATAVIPPEPAESMLGDAPSGER